MLQEGGVVAMRSTRTGRRELQEWLTRKPQMQPFRNELLLKLFFGRLVPREACQEHLRHFRQRQEDFLRTYRQVESWLHTEHERHPDLPFWLMTLTLYAAFRGLQKKASAGVDSVTY